RAQPRVFRDAGARDARRGAGEALRPRDRPRFRASRRRQPESGLHPFTYALRTFPRELRSGEVLVLLAAVCLAVASLTAVRFLTDRIGRAVARQANEVLAADLRLRSPEEIPREWRDTARRYGLETADTLTFPTVVFAG